MILTVTLNAAVDRTYRIEGFVVDRVHRPVEWRVAAGGKGVNVARVYQTLGGRAVALAFLGGQSGGLIEQALADEGIEAAPVRTAGESRLCIAVVDPAAHTQTEVNETGPPVSAAEVSALRDRVRDLLAGRQFAFVALSGSVPPGTPDGIYADLIEVARAHGVRAVLDASGAALRDGVRAVPWMVKPNYHEACALAGADLRSEADLQRLARHLRSGGIEVVALTLGERGALCVRSGSVLRARPPAVEFVSAVGSGDAFVAAYLWSDERGCAPDEALRMAVGAGAANAAVYGAGFCTAAAIREAAGGTEMIAVPEDST